MSNELTSLRDVANGHPAIFDKPEAQDVLAYVERLEDRLEAAEKQRDNAIAYNESKDWYRQEATITALEAKLEVAYKNSDYWRDLLEAS